MTVVLSWLGLIRSHFRSLSWRWKKKKKRKRRRIMMWLRSNGSSEFSIPQIHAISTRPEFGFCHLKRNIFFFTFFQPHLLDFKQCLNQLSLLFSNHQRLQHSCLLLCVEHWLNNSSPSNSWLSSSCFTPSTSSSSFWTWSLQIVRPKTSSHLLSLLPVHLHYSNSQSLISCVVSLTSLEFTILLIGWSNGPLGRESETMATGQLPSNQLRSLVVLHVQLSMQWQLTVSRDRDWGVLSRCASRKRRGSSLVSYVLPMSSRFSLFSLSSSHFAPFLTLSSFFIQFGLPSQTSYLMMENVSLLINLQPRLLELTISLQLLPFNSSHHFTHFGKERATLTFKTSALMESSNMMPRCSVSRHYLLRIVDALLKSSHSRFSFPNRTGHQLSRASSRSPHSIYSQLAVERWFPASFFSQDRLCLDVWRLDS